MPVPEDQKKQYPTSVPNNTIGYGRHYPGQYEVPSEDKVNTCFYEPIYSESFEYKNSNIKPVKVLEWNEKTFQLTMENPEKYRQAVILTEDIKKLAYLGTYNNTWGQLKGYIKSLPGGPYYLDARDGKLTIHNKKNLPPIRSYTYMGGNGELLEFSVKSNYVKSTVEVSANTDLDSDKNMTRDLGMVINDVTDPVAKPNSNYSAFADWRIHPLDPYAVYPAYQFNGGSPWRQYINYDEETGKLIPSRQGQLLAGFSDGPRQFSLRANTGSSSYTSTGKDGKVNASYVFSSEEDAIAAIQKDPRLSDEELKKGLSDLRRSYEVFKKIQISGDIDDLSPEEIAASLHDLNRLDFKITRKIPIHKIVSGSELYDMGEKTLNSKPVFSPNNATYNEKVIARVQNQGFDYLKTQYPNTSVFERTSEGGATVTYEVELEIPLSGARIFSQLDKIVAPDTLVNDLIQTTIDQVTATARVLGRPELESSHTIQVNNVSNRYSGLWYIKKAVHRINTGIGYNIDIDFVKRDTQVSALTVHQVAAVQKTMAQLQKAGNKAMEMGAYEKLNEYEVSLRETAKRAGYDGSSDMLITPNEDVIEVNLTTVSAKTDQPYLYANPTKELPSEKK